MEHDAYEKQADPRDQGKDQTSSPTTESYGTAGQAAGPIGSADFEVRRDMMRTIDRQRQLTDDLHRRMVNVHYLEELFNCLPTKLPHDAAMGLKLLLRTYNSSLL